MRIAVTIIALLFAFSGVATAQSYSDIPGAVITSIYDADTFRADLPDCPALFCKNVPIRVDGVDTPEPKGKGITVCEKRAGLRAKEFTTGLLRAARSITLAGPQRGKYFRVVAGVRLEVDGEALQRVGAAGQWAPGEIYEVDLSALLIENGHAYEYHGGKKEKFTCRE